jgi:Cyclic nucleotide-binding domain
VTFFQTAGGRTGVPAPRRVRRAPYVQFSAPLAWTTLALTLRADGSSSFAMTGGSSFPRHWVYGGDSKLALKSGMIDFSNWYRRAFGKHSPWGDQDSQALTTEVESALERQLSLTLMQGGAKPKIKTVKPGTVITEQGAAEDDIYLVLDGVVRIEVDGERLAEYGPGSMHGERAILEGGRRTSTIRAVTACKLAVAGADNIDRDALAQLSTGHRREDHR